MNEMCLPTLLGRTSCARGELTDSAHPAEKRVETRRSLGWITGDEKGKVG